MAPRGRLTSASENAYDSSPDPLSMSMNSNNRRKTTRTPKEALRNSSPNKQNLRPDASETNPSSPSKSMVLNTPRVGASSPWRIKVTVQAEPGTDEENADSPSVNRYTRTQTITVPLKDADSPSPVKRTRGRPRKSDIGTTTKPKRSGTPVRRKTQSKTRDHSIGAAGSSAADVDTDAPPKRPRGRPRKSVQPATEDEDTIVVEIPETQNSRSLEAKFAPKPLISNQTRARKGTPRSNKIAPVVISSDEDSDEDSDVLTPTSGDEEDAGGKATTPDPYVSRTARQDSSMPSEKSSVQSSAEPEARPSLEYEDDDEYAQPFDDADDDDDDIGDDNAPDVTNFAFEEGTTRMPDDMTILDSENFSMISVDSLPSNGGLSSPLKPAEPENIASMLQHEYLRPSTLGSIRLESKMATNSSPGPPRSVPASSMTVDSSRSATAPRYKTPVVDAENPSEPPAIEPAQITAPKMETPRLGRVVTAGVALQGLVDPVHLTPEPSQTAQNEKQSDRLNDLFRGFSTGTRKDLRAGLRLGEQLAQSKTKEQSSPVPSKPIKAQPEAAPKESVFRTQRKQRSRLLTPEEQDELVTTETSPPAEETSVQYPTLAVTQENNQIPSPAESEKEMNWGTDAAPVGTLSAEGKRFMTVRNEHGEMLRGTQIAVTADHDKKEDNYDDIWQEEASRSSISPESEESPAERSPQHQDLFAEEGRIGPARGKAGRAWRRKNATSPVDLLTPPVTESAAPVATSLEKSKTDEVETVTTQDDESDDESAKSDASDDTGMFFQSNLPSVFNKRRSHDLKQRKADKLDLSLLMNESASLLSESSPPVVAKKTPAGRKSNPFLDTPPRFPACPTSPKKSSPLRRELRGSDISSDTSRHEDNESSLPLVQSSPFRVRVDDDSLVSVTSDQRQLRDEMEGVAVSSIRRVRNEADGYLEAYETQDRSLDEIEEVTEASKTGLQDTSVMPSSPPQARQNLEQRMRSIAAMRETAQRAMQSTSSKTTQPKQQQPDSEMTDASDDQATSTSSTQHTPPTSESHPEDTQPGPISRMTSTLWTAVARPEPAPQHPILSKLTPLPKLEPWTKTHYKALDTLYTTHLKHPALFSPSPSTSTSRTSPLAQTNARLLAHFLATTNHPYVGATFSAWGYSMQMTQELVVLAAVFMQLLSLESVDEYERVVGKRIQRGDCAPGVSGTRILGEEVVRRLATVVMGESVRRDEKAGRRIERREGLTVVWP
ncbi:hypothetical protein P153DRAFT_366037 [Dothidotthia symphoricarpi CBS 119687]|uniref:Uncharacterized protein n=1 Tax=Dothidotthia symphoricarpi CBS 119687 TaxID=1392245 RepID=A0A6A6AJ37_9PLEO|nr:uncharacterized protein P153DRAFT_366037 [Dothidotthia symphoricarpi CBS 119687]KAF2130451.1 hypothetical protein P153DRAFT_366037 [Dothidotthia symphoricarpi CBS 119687]